MLFLRHCAKYNHVVTIQRIGFASNKTALDIPCILCVRMGV